MFLHYPGGMEYIAVVSGGSPRIRATDPFLHHLPVGGLRAAEGWEGDAGTAEKLGLLERFRAASGEALAAEAATRHGELGLIMKRPSRAESVELFQARHGMRAGAAASTPRFEGMAKLLSRAWEIVPDDRVEAEAEIAGKPEAAATRRRPPSTASRREGTGWSASAR